MLSARCRFFRVGCSGEDHSLFRSEYTRSNRRLGTKLLRCFPHCCPDHVPRGFCGCSLNLLVTFSDDNAVPNPDQILVCARFEAAEATGDSATYAMPTRSPSGQPRAALPAESASEMVTAMALGEEVALPVQLLSPSYSSSMEDTWVVATKQHTSEDGVVYVLNNHHSPKWFYGFTSGATKAQRDMRHTLVVYVFRLLSPPLDRQQAQPDPSDRPLHASVLARQTSPSFTIVSHRRAYYTQGREASVTAPDPQTERVSTEEVTVQSVAVDTRNNLYAASSEVGDAPVVVQESRSDDAGVGRTVDAVEERLEETKEHMEKDNVTFWHLGDLPRHSGVVEKVKHLLLLRFFLGAATIDVFGFMLPRLDNHIRDNWFGTSVLGRFPPTHVDELTAAFSLAAFQVAAPRRVPGSTRSIPDLRTLQQVRQDEFVLGTCVELLMELFTSPAVSKLVHTAFHLGGGQAQAMPNKAQLREGFIQFISGLYEILELGLTRRGNSNNSGEGAVMTLPELVDSVLSLVYSQTRFVHLRPHVSALLLNPGGTTAPVPVNRLFRAFTAQVRESFITRQQRHHQQPQRVPGLLSDRTQMVKSWSRRWVVEPASIRVVPTTVDSDWHQCPPLLPLLYWIRLLVGVDVQIDAEATNSCTIRSVYPEVGLDDAASMQLVLDGRQRMFRAFPNGLASLAVEAEGYWLVGDYTGVFLAGHRALEVAFFVVATEESAESDVYRHEESKEEGKDEHILPRKVAVRRAVLTLTLEDPMDAEPPWMDGRCFVRCVFSKATFVVQDDDFNNGNDARGQPETVGKLLAGLSCAARMGRLQALSWTQVTELRASYVGVVDSRAVRTPGTRPVRA